ncbi:KH domain-containing protein [Quillaja saponaria]|uniref:KH domain-containing protein n=1 Tax=Quillaja saponaria TaxID=32244 RepID=A0AAD7Q6G6_QUISA|nr:KH domain-containing protein [Quillaja saponaria]
MDGSKRDFFKRRPGTEFKRKGGNKKGKWNNSIQEQSLGNSPPGDTVYRILCPSRKIGSVIGKGGGIVKALRQETQAKITVADSVPGSDERVIIIYSSPARISRKHDSDEDSAAENEDELMQPHCAAQDAVLKVHDRIVEEDLFGGVTFDDGNEEIVVTARLLVPNNMVGCVLGKRGDVIQKLRSETGANIRVLPPEHLPPCAMSTDELVQISGKPEIAKRALYEVSTLLHQNPRKDKPPLSFPVPYGGQGFHPHASVNDMLPPENPAWSQRNAAAPHGISPRPWVRFEDQPSRFVPGGFDGPPPTHGREAPAEFSMKILCSSGKIGGVIGKGGVNVRQLQQDTGSGIHVQDMPMESDERVICVSAIEALWDPRSQTIEAILQLQQKTSEFSEKGVITTRLLVPSSKVGCILGQGGHVINEMRRRTRADIRVYSKDDKPKSAAEDEELVQITGNFVVAKDALAEIASRLRVRTLRDASAGPDPTPPPKVPVQRFGATGGLPFGGLPSSRAVGVGSSGGYNSVQGGLHEYEPSYPFPPAATGYSNVNNALEVKNPNDYVGGSVIGKGTSNIPNINEVGGARVKFQDSHAGGSEFVDIHGSSEHLNGARNSFQSYMASGGQNMNVQHDSYHNINPQQGHYQKINSHPKKHDSYHNINPQQGHYQNINSHPNSYQSSYRNVNAQQSPYQMSTQKSPYQTGRQQSPYQMSAQQGSYPTNINGPQSVFHNMGAQQGAYHY